MNLKQNRKGFLKFLNPFKNKKRIEQAESDLEQTNFKLKRAEEEKSQANYQIDKMKMNTEYQKKLESVFARIKERSRFVMEDRQARVDILNELLMNQDLFIKAYNIVGRDKDELRRRIQIVAETLAESDKIISGQEGTAQSYKDTSGTSIGKFQKSFNNTLAWILSQ